MSARQLLKAYVRLDAGGRIVPGSMVIRTKQPREGQWVLVDPAGGKAIYVEQFADGDVLVNGTLVPTGETALAYGRLKFSTTVGTLIYSIFGGDGLLITSDDNVNNIDIAIPAGATRVRIQAFVLE
jgi:hypothetical protein